MEFVTNLAANTQEFFTSLSFDVLIVLTLSAFFFTVGLRAGKTRLINFVFSMYLATLLLLFFPFKNLISFDFGLLFDKYDIVGLGLLLIVASSVQIVVGYVLELEYDGHAFRNTVNNVLLSFSASVALLAASYITGIVKVTDSSSSFLDAFYTSEQYLFGLLVLPLIGVFIVAR